MTKLATSNGQDVSAPSWGEANQRRGRAHLDTAIKFVQAFPIGSTLSTDDFDIWAHSEGLLVLPLGVARNSDAWKAHVQKRNEVRLRQINVAGAHPRMTHQGSTPFVVDVVGSDLYEVKPPERAAVIANAYPKIANVLATQQERIKRMYQAVNFNDLPPHELAIAEQFFDNLTDMTEMLTSVVDNAARRFDKFKGRVEFLVAEREQKQLSSSEPEIIEQPQADRREA